MRSLWYSFSRAHRNWALLVPQTVFSFVTGLIAAAIIGWCLRPAFASGQGGAGIDSVFLAIGPIRFLASLGAIILLSLIGFIAGAWMRGGVLGMAKDAAQTGNSRLGSFWGYAKKHGFRLLMLALLIYAGETATALLSSAAQLFLPSPDFQTLANALGSGAGFSNLDRGQINAIVWLIGFHAFFRFLYSLLVMFAPYALVYEECDPIAAFAKGAKMAFKGFVAYLLPAIAFVALASGAAWVCVQSFRLGPALGISLSAVSFFYFYLVSVIWNMKMYEELR